MDIWSSEKLALFLIFFLPGFISMKVYDLLVPGEPRDFSKSFLEAISFSTLNFAALFPLIVWMQTSNLYKDHLYGFWLCVVAIMVLVPSIWPFAFLGLVKLPFVADIIVNPIQKPWDYIFSKRKSYWVVVHLKDGRKIGGKFGAKSYASSNPAEEQSYLQEVWRLDEAGSFIEAVKESGGILIMSGEISAVEFFQV